MTFMKKSSALRLASLLMCCVLCFGIFSSCDKQSDSSSSADTESSTDIADLPADTEISLDLPTDRTVKVALVGDETIFAHDIAEDLEDMLGNGYDVQCFSGTIVREEMTPEFSFPIPCSYCVSVSNTEDNFTRYTESEAYRESLDFAPDVVIIMLGTFDAADMLFDDVDTVFGPSYKELAESYKALDSKPYVIALTCPFATNFSSFSSTPVSAFWNPERINETIVPLQKKVFAELYADGTIDGVVDIFAATKECYSMSSILDLRYYSPVKRFHSVISILARRIFNAGPREVAVTTAPNAEIIFDSGDEFCSFHARSDSKGKARCYVNEQTYTVKIRADGYETFTQEVAVTDSTKELSFTLAEGYYNVALNATVTAWAADEETGGIQNAVDSDPSTVMYVKYSHAEAKQEGGASRCVPNSIIIDLGKAVPVSGIRMHWATSGSDKGKINRYFVQFSSNIIPAAPIYTGFYYTYSKPAAIVDLPADHKYSGAEFYDEYFIEESLTRYIRIDFVNNYNNAASNVSFYEDVIRSEMIADIQILSKDKPTS